MNEGKLARREATLRRGRWRTLMASMAIAVVVGGCVLPGADEASDGDAAVEREQRRSGDIDAEVGDTVEVHGVEATVLEVGRVDAYGDIDTSGYVWARIRVENTSGRTLDFHRRHIQLEKPDGTLANTTNIPSETQIEGGTTGRSDQLAPGTVREGIVIYTAGDLDGQFAVVYAPPPPSGDDLDAERAVWIFQSSPEQSE